ncbi:MAG: serine hydrolase domain-containing protein [Bacteroidota bacterium]
MIKNKKAKLIARILLLIGTVISLFFVPWILVKAWILPLPDTIQAQVAEAIGHGFDGMIVYVDQAGKLPAFYTGGWKDRANKIPANPKSLFKIASISKLYSVVAATKLVKENRLSFDKTLIDYLPSLKGRIENAEKITLKMMIQHIASVSKTFAGAAVVKAIEQGLFTMETNINDLLPVTLVNPKQSNAAIKVKHLVTHTSGLLDNAPLYLATNWYILPEEDLATEGAKTLMNQIGIEAGEAVELGDFLAEYFLEDGDLYFGDNFANTAPGSNWAYSNLATGLMGFIIETASLFSTVLLSIAPELGMNDLLYFAYSLIQKQKDLHQHVTEIERVFSPKTKKLDEKALQKAIDLSYYQSDLS